MWGRRPDPARRHQPDGGYRGIGAVASPTAALNAATRGLARPAPAQAGSLTIYLPRLFEDDSLGLRAVIRPTRLPDQMARQALEELIQGPTGDERAADFEYPLSPRTALRDVRVANGTAIIDFESGLDRVNGRPYSELVFWSIIYTLTDVPGIDRAMLMERGTMLHQLGDPPFAVPATASRADAPDWARPR